MPITLKQRDIVFEKNVSAGSVIYNVRSIRVVDGEVTTSTLNGDRFGLMFAGLTYYEAYGFSGNSLLLGHIFVYFYHVLEKCSFVVFFILPIV